MINVCFSSVSETEEQWELLFWMMPSERLESSSLFEIFEFLWVYLIHLSTVVSFICAWCHTVMLHISVADRAEWFNSGQWGPLRPGCSKLWLLLASRATGRPLHEFSSCLGAVVHTHNWVQTWLRRLSSFVPKSPLERHSSRCSHVRSFCPQGTRPSKCPGWECYRNAFHQLNWTAGYWKIPRVADLSRF